MDELSYKVRIAALWLLSSVAYFAYRTIALSEGVGTGEMHQVSLLSNEDFASYLLVLMVFAVLSLLLPRRMNRLANMIAGAIIGVAQVALLADGLVGYPSAGFNLMTAVSLVAMAAVVWLAYRWPTEPTATTVGERETQHGKVPART